VIFRNVRRVTLSPRQRRFADAYLGAARFNATEAARIAGFKGKRHVLAVRGAELLRNPYVRAHLKSCADRAGAGRDEVLALLGRQMRGSMADFLTTEGPVRVDLEAARAGQHLGLVKKLHQKRRKRIRGTGANQTGIEETTIEIELYSAQEAAGLLAKALGLGRPEEQAQKNMYVSQDRIIERLLHWGIPTEKWLPGLVRRHVANQRARAQSTERDNDSER
jgi:phage terminase small subunit